MEQRRIDDAAFGTRNRRGDWAPNEAITPPPLFVLPPRPLALLAWLPHYFLPWNVVWMVTATACWLWLTPGKETLQTLAPGWIVLLFLRNALAVFLFYGALEFRLYLRRAQGTQFKFNGKWPAETRRRVFLFGSQNADGLIRTFASGVPIWTAYEVLVLWAWANGIGPWTTLDAHPLWLAALWLVVPIVHEFHFFAIHRLIHIPILYKWVHSVHHNHVNTSPWSSLAMHPVEHLLYWSVVLVHFIVPSHPLIAIYQLQNAGFGAVVGHIGFDKIVIGDGKAMDTHTYTHYLHHKYFEVNYADGLIPLDRMFGTFHDGTKEGDARLASRRAKQRMPTAEADGA